jgi:citrate synthase
MTGELPTDEDSNDIKEFWSKNGKLSDETLQFIKQLPVDTHPMTMLSMSLLFLQRDSVFHKLYAEGKLN